MFSSTLDPAVPAVPELGVADWVISGLTDTLVCIVPFSCGPAVSSPSVCSPAMSRCRTCQPESGQVHSQCMEAL